MIQTSDFKKWFTLLFAETFGVSDAPQGFMLESGLAGLLGTIDALSAEVASAIRPPEHVSIASQCGHILFLLRLFDAYDQGQAPAPDWPGSWSSRSVDEAAWGALRGELRAAYGNVAARLQTNDAWPEPRVAAALMLLAHCSYHVGQVRQLLTFVGEPSQP